MKKVLVVSGKLTVGGAERICRNIGFYADRACFQIDYLVFGNEVGTYEAELEEKGCKIWHMVPPSNGYLRFFRGLEQLLRDNRYDVVHCHTMFNSGLVLRAAARCGVPVRIAHSHSIRGPEHRGLKKNIYEKTMRRWIARFATYFIGCGKDAGNWLFGERLFREKGIILLNGIELEQYRYDPAFRESIREKHRLQSGFLIGHVGHLAPVKNQVFLLRIMPEILRKRPDAHLFLIGEGSDRKMLEQSIQANHLEEAVTMTGNISNVNEYLSAMDVFAFPSLYEGMPLSIVEAQANGLPCVISDRVPKDVFLTDLLRPLPLEQSEQDWIAEILGAKRGDPEEYYEILRKSNFSADHMLSKLFLIYQGKKQ